MSFPLEPPLHKVVRWGLGLSSPLSKTRGLQTAKRVVAFVLRLSFFRQGRLLSFRTASLASLLAQARERLLGVGLLDFFQFPSALKMASPL